MLLYSYCLCKFNRNFLFKLTKDTINHKFIHVEQFVIYFYGSILIYAINYLLTKICISKNYVTRNETVNKSLFSIEIFLKINNCENLSTFRNLAWDEILLGKLWKESFQDGFFFLFCALLCSAPSKSWRYYSMTQLIDALIKISRTSPIILSCFERN